MVAIMDAVRATQNFPLSDARGSAGNSPRDTTLIASNMGPGRKMNTDTAPENMIAYRSATRRMISSDFVTIPLQAPNGRYRFISFFMKLGRSNAPRWIPGL